MIGRWKLEFGSSLMMTGWIASQYADLLLWFSLPFWWTGDVVWSVVVVVLYRVSSTLSVHTRRAQLSVRCWTLGWLLELLSRYRLLLHPISGISGCGGCHSYSYSRPKCNFCRVISRQIVIYGCLYNLKIRQHCLAPLLSPATLTTRTQVDGPKLNTTHHNTIAHPATTTIHPTADHHSCLSRNPSLS
jgi:hypothetical protein